MFTLYLSKGSSALAPQILLEELGVAYQTDERPIPKGAHLSPEYLAINPKGRVPALATKTGIITENPAILWYLGETFPDHRLLPADPYARAKVQEINAYICATVHIAFAHKQRGQRWSDDPAIIEGMKHKVAANMRDAAALIDNQYIAGPWVLGETYSISDPYVFLVQRWLGLCDIDIADYPKLAAHKTAMLERPATRAAMAAQGL